MKLNVLGKNQTIVTINDGVFVNEIFFSYDTPVAGFIYGQWVRTSKKFSVTTTKHINNYLQGKLAIEKDQSFFDTL